MVDISKREILYPIKNIMAQILCIPGGCDRAHLPRLRAEYQRQHSHENKQEADLDDVAHVAVGNAHVDDLCHQKRDQHFHEHFKTDQYRSQK